MEPTGPKMGNLALVVRAETGEILTEINPGDRILRKRSLDHLKDVKTWKIDHFYKGNLREISKWMKDLSTNERAMLFTLSPYIGYDDCCLKHENGDMVTFDFISGISDMGRATVSRTLNALIKKDILYRGKNSKERQYFINPWLFCKGNRINIILQTMFRNYRIRVMNNAKWGSLKPDASG